MAEIVIDVLLAAVLLVAIVFPLIVQKKDSRGLTKKQKNVVKRIRLSAVMVLVLQFLPATLFDKVDGFAFSGFGRLMRLAAYLVAYWVVGNDILKRAWKGIQNRRAFDENFLMAIATVGALAIAVYTNGDYLEAVAVMLFYQLGELFQAYAVGKSRRSISQLMDIRPDYANVEIDGKPVQVDPGDVAIGTLIVVLPGEKVPLDGVVAEGSATLNTAALTGESLPRDVSSGDTIISGCINMTGVLKIRTTKTFGESTVSKILDLVENASSRKSKSEQFIAKFSRVYTPAVCYGALALALLPPLVLCGIGADPAVGTWIYRALTFLVISCPCALVISIPLSFFAGIGGASRAGVLIKGSNYMETFAKTKIVVFDKTGTLTRGVFEVSKIYSDMEESRLLEYAAYAESFSSHPIAKSIVAAYGKAPDRSRVTDLKEVAGLGITARVDGTSVAAGNEKLMESLSIAYEACHDVGTVAYLAVDGTYAGCIVISDALKTTSAKAVKKLKKMGISKTVMLTGDRKEVAESIGKELAIDEIHCELLPNHKVEQVEQLLMQKRGNQKLAFVGDGINDAPVLSRADIGIAMGAMGSDAAIEAADVVLMDDDPMKIVQGIGVAKKCISIVYQNIAFALIIKFTCLALGAVGIANMWFAIFADVGVMVLAVLNAVRALRVKTI